MSAIRQHIDVLIGGPAHGQVVAVEPTRAVYEVVRLAPVVSAEPFARTESHAYMRHKMRMGKYREVSFYADSTVGGERACEMLWDHLMNLAGARLA